MRFSESTTEQVKAYTDRLVTNLEGVADSPGVKLLTEALLTLARDGTTAPSQVAQVINTVWYELECQGFVQATRSGFEADDAD